MCLLFMTRPCKQHEWLKTITDSQKINEQKVVPLRTSDKL